VERLLRRDAVRIPAVVAACVLLWIWRRPEQLSRPYVWVEESYIIKNFLEDGWSGAFDPIQGYLILPANALVSLATWISFLQVPKLMYGFALAVFAATILLLLVPESRWGGLATRSAMAISMTLVPTNPEVFGVLLYSFWWTTLWPLIVLGWRRDLWPLRAPVLAIGALSSPAGGALFVVFGLAYLLSRRTTELISAGILLAGFVVQVALGLGSTRAELLSRDVNLLDVAEQVLRTGALFETRWLLTERMDANFLLFIGVIFFSFLLVAIVSAYKGGRQSEALLLGAGAGVLTVLSAFPAPLISDPASAGPRYYFLPFVAFGWTLIALWRSATTEQLKLASLVLLCVPLLTLAKTFSRAPEETAANLSWEREVHRCAASNARLAEIPIYFDGSKRWFWTLALSPGECRRLAGEDRPILPSE
jgi:hypothetical protein